MGVIQMKFVTVKTLTIILACMLTMLMMSIGLAEVVESAPTVNPGIELSTQYPTVVAKAGDNKYGRALKEFVTSYGDTHVNKEGENASVVHDATAVMYAIDPEGCETEECHIEIKVDDVEWGRSYPTYDDPAKFNTTVITDVDMRRYEQLYIHMMEYYNNLGE